jgi:hypothetical protein
MSATDTLVLMPCGALKADMRTELHELYRGPLWTTLRKYRGAIPLENICVLSAEYGFVNVRTIGEPYDRKLGRAQADHLSARGIMSRNDRFGTIRGGCTGPSPWVETNCASRKTPYARVIMAGAGNYALVMNAFIAQLREAKGVSRDAPVWLLDGGIGRQRAMLGTYLRDVNSTED